METANYSMLPADVQYLKQTFKQSVYFGIAEGNWKQRLYNHKQSF